MTKVALLDADIFVYRVGAVTNGATEQYALKSMDNFMDNLVLFDLEEDEFDWELYLTDSKSNFRIDVAVTAPYKGNRKNVEKPKHFDALRQHLIDQWYAELQIGIEADDKLAIRATELGEDNAVIVSLDKDLDQVVGWHHNFQKHERYYVDQSTANLLFGMQFLTGDRVDNIIGVRGIGKVKAERLLTGKSVPEMWDIIVDKLGIDRAIENGKLLYMLRSHDDEFTPPDDEATDWINPRISLRS